MSQKKETFVLLLSLLITLVLIGFGATWLLNTLRSPNAPGNLSTGDLNEGNPASSPAGSDAGSDPSSGELPASEIGNRLSGGDRLILTNSTSPQKQAGIAALAAGNYDQAVAQLEAALNANRNDPEALIYLNNARIATQPSYTLAVVIPSSAPDVAAELLRGIAQAQTEVNQAGGIQGTPLRIVIADDGDDEAIARQLANAIASQPDILGVIGHFSSGTTLAAAEVYQSAGVPMISPTSTSVRISELGDYIFRTVQSDRFAADGLARYMVNTLQTPSVAVFYNSQSDYSNSLKDAFTSAVFAGGGQVTSEIDLSSSSFNAAAAVEQAIQQGAQTLMLANNTGTRRQALEVVAANQGRLRLLGGDSLYNAELLQAGGAAAVGMVVAAPWHRDANPGSSFPQASRQLWGGDVSWRTALAYDAAQVFLTAIAQGPTRAGIHQALNATSFSATGASGSIQFLPSGDRNQATQLVIVRAGNSTGYGYEFAPVP